MVWRRVVVEIYFTRELADSRSVALRVMRHSCREVTLGLKMLHEFQFFRCVLVFGISCGQFIPYHTGNRLLVYPKFLSELYTVRVLNVSCLSRCGVWFR